jgi:hypothetical protein
MTSPKSGLWPVGLLGALITAVAAAGPLDQLTDLTGKAQAVVTFKGRDNFTTEYVYDVAVKNYSPDRLAGDSLVIVLDKITNVAGEEREPLKGDRILDMFEVVGQDGQTDDGKPFFRIPADGDVAPQGDSRPATVRLRNREYVAVFTPSFRVYGTARRPAPEPKPAEAVAPKPAQPPATAAPRSAVDRLIQLLIKKGVLTEEEWRRANQP